MLICLLCIFFDKVSMKVFGQFFSSDCFLLSVSCLCLLDVNPLSDVSLASIFSQPAACLTLLTLTRRAEVGNFSEVEPISYFSHGLRFWVLRKKHHRSGAPCPHPAVCAPLGRPAGFRDTPLVSTGTVAALALESGEASAVLVALPQALWTSFHQVFEFAVQLQCHLSEAYKVYHCPFFQTYFLSINVCFRHGDALLSPQWSSGRKEVIGSQKRLTTRHL